MKNFAKLLCATAAVVGIGATQAFASQTYPGNGLGGFGGALGNSSLTVSDSASTGLITFKLTTGAGGFNDIGLYIDSVTGGFANTSTFTDSGDEGRRSLSGVSTPASNQGTALVNFATGFAADYGVALDDVSNANLFTLGTGAFAFVSGTNYSIAANGANSQILTFSVNATDIGLTANSGQSFRFVATLSNSLSGGQAQGNTGGVFRSNETIGAITSTPNNPGNSANPGNAGSSALTYSSFDTYTLAPEPSTYVAALVGIAALAVFMMRRRRA